MTANAADTGNIVLRTTVSASRARKAYWAGVREARQRGVPVVAAFGLLPREIWHAMDVPVVNMEALSLQASSRGLSGGYCEIAEAQGFARELCGVHLSLIGMSASPEKDAYVNSMFVKPDLIVGSTFACMSESRSFLAWADRLGCPTHVVDVPVNPWGRNVPGRAVDYAANELRSLVAFLEAHGFACRPERLAGAVRNSRRTMELWWEVDRLRRTVPAPMTAVDALVCIGNTLITLMGSETCVELFGQLRDELAARAGEGKGVIADERLRLFLVGIPPLYHLRLLDYPEKYGAVVVKSDLDFFGGSLMDPALLDPSRPFESLALKQMVDVVNPCYALKIDEALRTVREYRIDGVIGLSKRGCRNLPAALRLVKDAVAREGVPMSIFDLDGIDAREYDESRVKGNIDSFLETLVRTRRKG